MEISDGARDRSAAGAPGAQQAFVALGSNLGDREAHLAHAARELAGLDRTERVAISSLFETDPVGGPPQGRYLNAVVELATLLSPHALLRELLAIETRAGRIRSVPDGPRILDLDLLTHGSQQLGEADLILPHPRLHERAFVLTPLVEIAAEVRHPVRDRSFAALLHEVRGREGVRPFPPRNQGASRWPSSP